ncbi:glycosyltransferase family 4 protein [Actinoplanes sp. NPDC049265]|uniref:glycosyltransferase family 4 protein n=1 Tax=Actinoplanes sp. NPDC049265 TaxID=3363902 RepID=UPI003722A159
MRLLWISDSPSTPSGFATVTREVCRRLRDRGHRIEILGWQTRGAATWWEGLPVHPVRHDQFGADVLLGYLMRIRPDYVVSLADVWWMSFMTDPQIQSYLDMSGTRWVHYYPVDGADPAGRLAPGWAELLRSADVPIAMSRWGQAVSAASGVPAEYIPHGVDLDVFRPPADRAGAKAALGYTDRFVVLSDARNQPRKMLPRTLDVLRLLAGDPRYGDVMFHLHCDPRDPAAESELYAYSVLHDLELLGLLDRVRFTAGFEMRADGGVTMTELSRLYQAADVHLLSSYGEGFGLPTLQAAAAGVVPIAVAASASRELVGTHGVAVPVESTMRDEFGLVRTLLDTRAAATAIAALHEDPSELADRSARSRAFAQGYSWEDIAGSWERCLRAAPARRRAVRSRTYAFVAGAAPDPAVPTPLRSALAPAVAGLPEGASVEVRVTERRHGEAAGRIRVAAFTEGDELSIPVRLPPLLPGARRAHVGWVLAGPGSLAALAPLQTVFPGTRIAVTTPALDITTGERLPLEELVAALPSYALVADHAADACPGLDLACAVVGVPYHGPSPWWPPVTGEVEPDDVSALRRLLTDQGFSRWRRDIARAAAADTVPADVVRHFEELAAPAREQVGAVR